MSVLPRTPVYWPRMKVRGRRNRAKLAARYTSRRVMYVHLESRDPHGVVMFTVTTREQATHVLNVAGKTVDGYGRVAIPAVISAPVITPKPEPKPAMSWGMTFETQGVTPALLDLISGRRPPENALVQDR